MMVGESRRLTLAEYLGMTQIGSMAEKKLFGGYDVPLMRFLTVGFWLFNEGAVFGRARSNKLETVAKMFLGIDLVANAVAQLGLPAQLANNEQWVFEFLRKVGTDGMTHYHNRYQREPESLLDLWLTSFAPPEFDFRDLQKMRQLANSKIRLGIALQQSDSWLFVGISFGASFPELVEKLWKKEYEEHDPESWSFWREHGLDIPEKFTPIPLEEMEQQVLAEVTSYVTEYIPELVNPLSLRLR
jgi:hypothetical protein